MGGSVYFFAIGFKDDIVGLSSSKKFVAQLFASILVIHFAKVHLTSLHGLFGIGEFPVWLGYLATMFTIIVITNSFNLIDGVDGLAGSMGIVTSSFFAFFGLMSGEYYYALIGFTFAASLGAFLIYNYTPARIFMGDTGAMLIGVVNAILVIHFINMAENTKILPVLASPAMGFGVLLLPLLDTLRVFAIRILHGRSPFSPDRNHLHHLLLDRGLSHMSITVILSAFAILIIFITYFLLPIGTTKVILLQLVGFFGVVGFLQYGKPRKSKKLKVIKGNKLDESGAGIKAAYRNLGVFGNGDALNIDKE
ncbi:MAG: undecaprenyl/decaprenyl-phosphate alpha-N-acetylglucosaminyl 1-phosphate transferase [Sphingobacteriia bacterium]|nr:MAG: undecaprenyl/decaprenyl-phosphate alpha-N-acetylglucosaminyl 1-phosphate transferase [Sphingobacteriia bacterium]